MGHEHLLMNEVTRGAANSFDPRGELHGELRAVWAGKGYILLLESI